ncbi:hypothetical protein KIL84_006795 [Mauremys mutica]|uniref:Uncharacterized protein n=1 Tax=Mauremys mutica TaxID=74926 RepID=A0A9D4APP7_9SAUR|nr:hypothetical protein KIL84_006795 [Mauremys mutica]
MALSTHYQTITMCSLLKLTLTSIQKLKRVQNSAAYFLSRISHFKYISPVLHYLHRLALGFWEHFKVLILTYKALLNGLGSAYLRDPHPYAILQQLRSAEAFKLQLPWLREKQLLAGHFL